MRVHHRIVLAIVAVIGVVACNPDQTVTATSPLPPPSLSMTDDEPQPLELTAEQVQYLAAVAWRDAEARAFLEHVAAVRAAVPYTLRVVRWCEAGGYVGLPFLETNYTAMTHGYDGASGGYQMLGSTYTAWAAELGVDVSRWPRAFLAPDWVQDVVATHGFRTRGTTPWNASDYCWAHRT